MAIGLLLFIAQTIINTYKISGVMRIHWLFILFGVGIFNLSSIRAAELSDDNNHPGSALSESNLSALPSSTVVSNYAGAAYFFGPSDRSIWASTTNAVGAPDDTGSLSFIFPGDTSRYLYLRNFNFNIPCNALIESITVRVRRRNRSTVDLTDETVATFNPITLSLGATNMATTSVWVEGGAWEEVTYTDLTWGETLTPELVNNNRFGIVLSATNILTAGRGEALVDAVEMEVCYNVTGSPSTPIFYTLDKVDACYGEGSITVNATGGSGSFEYSINGGTTWQSSNFFGGLSQDDYTIMVRNSDMTCQTEPVNCNLSGDERILQPGDGVITCATYPGNRVTLGVEKLQPLHEMYITGEVGYDISTIIGPHAYKWDVDDFGGEVFSTAIDPDRNIYTATTIMYDLSPGSAIPVNVARIDGLTGEVNILATLPGDAGAAGVEYQDGCDQIFVANLSDGIIYRMDAVTGAVLSTFDPNTPDNGVPLIAPLGERVLSVAYNSSDGRLYYSMWNSDYDRSGIRNTIRSISILPGTCDFDLASDRLEISLPWTTEYGDVLNPDDFSMPVADMEFSQDGGTLIMSESGFDSTVPSTRPHESRALRYTGSSGSWTLQTGLPAGNTNLQYELGEVSAGLNARGGIAFVNSGFDSPNCTIDNDEFILGTADALRGADCNTLGCIYGLQFMPITGGRSENSVLLDVGRDLETQQKSVFGDIDVVSGCPEPLYCCPNLDSAEPDIVICPGDPVSTFTATTQADSLSLAYHTSIPADSAAVYTDGTIIDTQEVIGGSATLSLAGLDVSSPTTYYVYVITHPVSDLDYCRPYDSIVVTVRNLPTVSLNDPADRCITGSDMSFTGSPIPAGAQFASFTSDAPSGFVDNGDGTADLDISSAGAGTFTIDYLFTDEFGCSNTASTTVTIYDQPTVSISDPGDACVDAVPLAYVGTPSPSSGISGVFTSTASGLTDNGDGTASIDPAVAGVGSYSITYTFTDSNGCVNTATVNFDVNPLPVVTINDPVDECLTDGPMSFTGTPIPSSGISGVFTSTAPGGLTDNGDGTASLDFTGSGPGIFDVTYTFTDNNGCQNFATSSVQVFDTLPYVDLARGAVCGDPSFGSNVLDLNTLINSGPLGGIWADTDATGALVGSNFTANPTMEGNSYTFTYTITGPGPVATACQTRSFDVVVDVVYCYLDLALIKTTAQTTPVLENDLVQFDITVCNQGFTAVDSIEITDYLAPCYNFAPNNGWVASGPYAVLTLTESGGDLPVGGLPPVTASPSNCITVPLQLNIACGIPADLISYAELTGHRDIAGNTDDFDSNPGSNSIAENLVLPGDPDDDSFNDVNEDDHDPGVMPLADIALRKTIASGGPYTYGQSVSFNIELINQGNIDLYNIEVTDYIPCGFDFSSSNPPQWVDGGTEATRVISQLNAGQSTNITIDLDILESPSLCANSTSWQNEAEVSQIFRFGPVDISTRDYDSVINDTQGDDAGGAPGTASDDSILGDGSGPIGGADALTDEDDHDPALFNVYDLAIFKTETSSLPYGPDSVVTYQLVIENQGGVTANGIEVRDYPEIGLQYDFSDAGSNPNVTESPGLIWTIGSLAPGTSEVINLNFRIASGFQDLNLDNRAEITVDDGDDLDSNPSLSFGVDEDGDGDPFDDDEASVEITIDQFYDLSLVKTEASSGPYTQGSLITYNIEVTNGGTLNASGIRVQDDPGTGLSFISDNAFLNSNVTPIAPGVWEIGNLNFGQTETFQVSYEIDNAYQDITITNRAQIILDDGDDVDSDPSTDYTVDENGDFDPFDDDESEIILDVFQFYDLRIVKSEVSSGPYFPGDNISYRIDVINEGSLNASNIDFEDIADPDLSFISDNSSSNPNVSNISPLTYRIASLPFGTSESVVLSFQVNPIFQGDTVRNITQIIVDDGDDIDSDPSVDFTIDENGDFDPVDDDEFILDLEISQIYDLSVNKTLLTTGDIYPGDPVTFRIDIINEGTLNAANIELTEAPEPGLIYTGNTSALDPNITELSPTQFVISSLPAYTSTSFEISYDIDPFYLNQFLSNIVRISLDDGDDTDSDPAFDETVDEDGDGNPFDDDEAISTVSVFVGFSIGDYVWHDLNGDGLQSFGEEGIADLKVELYNSRGFLIDRTFTDASGFYGFAEVFPGEYYLKFDLQDIYEPTLDFVGFNTSIDSDITNAFGPGTTSLYDLDADNIDIDGGLIQCANIGGTVWFDYNKNDIMDPTENGINGMTVELYKEEPYGWTLWKSMETGHNEETPSDDGFYKFCTEPGHYYLRFINPPESLVAVIPGRGPEDLDSDVTGRFGPGTTDDFIVFSGDERCDIGAGYYIMGTIGDYIWHDSNGNGMQDESEQGVSGVVVNAMTAEGELIATAVSDEEGRYMLDYLGRDEYYIQVEQPLGWALSQAHMGDDETLDSDIDGSNGYGTSQLFPVEPGVHTANVDVGLVLGILPVEWVNINGSNKGVYNEINWLVSSEVNVSHYIVERATEESFDFEPVGVVPYKFAITDVNKYQYEDFSIDQNVSFYRYRVMQIDFDGQFTYSKIVTIKIEENDNFALNVELYPNPAIEYVNFSAQGVVSEDTVEIELIDSRGSIVKKNTLSQADIPLFQQGGYRMDISDLVQGIYFIRITTGQNYDLKKLIVTDP